MIYVRTYVRTYVSVTLRNVAVTSRRNVVNQRSNVIIIARKEGGAWERIIGERSEPHTYRTVGKNLRHIYIYVFYIYIYIYIRPYVVHVPLTRALRANVGPAG